MGNYSLNQDSAFSYNFMAWDLREYDITGFLQSNMCNIDAKRLSLAGYPVKDLRNVDRKIDYSKGMFMRYPAFDKEPNEKALETRLEPFDYSSIWEDFLEMKTHCKDSK